MKTIWCLFHIDNNYDQPDNNLIAWFDTFPTRDMIKQIKSKPQYIICALDDENMYNLLSKNLCSIPYNGEYRLQEVKSGEFIEYDTGAIKRNKYDK